jgi:hypothetical protein
MKTTAAIATLEAGLGLSGVAAGTNQVPPSSLAPPLAGCSGPKIVFATPIHDFVRVKAGELAK